MGVQLLGGGETLEVVGESNYQDALWSAVGGWREEPIRQEAIAVLVPEEDNPYDVNAVSVWVNGLKAGYWSRESAARYRPGLLALQARHDMRIALRGVIAGGGMRADGRGLLGILLSHDPAAFGLQGMARSGRRNQGMRTGLSDALATDGGDDSYDLEWLARLPEDGLAAIAKLRALLAEETDPIDRHYMFCELERRLYRSRDIFASALSEYDETCRAHDSEMDGIRAAMIAKWGCVPMLETYRQMTIRQQKAKRFEEALWWAVRGIAVYGAEAARPDAVEDLRKRAGSLQGRLLPPPPGGDPRART
jgi:hypothetical protein